MKQLGGVTNRRSYVIIIVVEVRYSPVVFMMVNVDWLSLPAHPESYQNVLVCVASSGAPK